MIRRAYMLSDVDRDVVEHALVEQIEITKASRDIMYGTNPTDELCVAARAAWDEQIEKLTNALERFSR